MRLIDWTNVATKNFEYRPYQVSIGKKYKENLLRSIGFNDRDKGHPL